MYLHYRVYIICYYKTVLINILIPLQLCEPIKMLPKCRYFRDMAWTLRSEGNGTLQTVHCHCPKGSVAYLLKRQAYQTESKQIGYQYSFACSPQSVSASVYYNYVLKSLEKSPVKNQFLSRGLKNHSRHHLEYVN